MNNAHHLLDLFDNINEKYKLQENDYKVFVEALGGKKEAIDFKNAKYVEICCDEYSTSFNEEKDTEEIICTQNMKKILRIVGDIESLESDESLESLSSICMDDNFMDNKSTTMARYQLQIISMGYARSSDNFYVTCINRFVFDSYLINIKSIKVLEKNG